MNASESAARELLARVSPHYQLNGYHLRMADRSEWVEVSAAIAALTEQSATIALLREALDLLWNKYVHGDAPAPERHAIAVKVSAALSALPEQAGVSE